MTELKQEKRVLVTEQQESERYTFDGDYLVELQ